MSSRNKPSLVCEFNTYFNVKDKVALDILELNDNLYLSGLIRSQTLIIMECILYIQHLIIN